MRSIFVNGLLGILVESFHSDPSEINCPPKIPQPQFDALLSVYTSMNGNYWAWQDDDIPWFRVDANGNVTNPCCPVPWTGIECQQNSITKLALPSFNVTGRLPSDIGSLEDLSELWLYDNHITGTIPSAIGRMTQLFNLFLYENNLIGTIPKEICTSTMYQFLLSYNSLSGTLPTEVGNMRGVRLVWLNNNNLSGTIPTEFGSPTRLQQLYLSNNLLSGFIPEGIFSNAMDYFYLSNNSLTGSIPSSIGIMTQVIRISLSNNSLVGQIPTQIVNSSLLQSLDLSFNSLEGSIPPAVFMAASLQNLSLNSNLLNGTIPSTIGMANLANIFLYSNKLTGTIPYIPRNSTIKGISFSNNSLTGRLSADVNCWPENLTAIDVTSNGLSGTLPSALFALRRLSQVLVRGNGFTGTLPTVIAESTSLQVLLLGNNKIRGRPDDVFNASAQKLLSAVDLSRNLFSGTVPSRVFSLPALQAFNAFSSCYSGSIPSSICSARHLEYLIMDGLITGMGCQWSLNSANRSYHAYWPKKALQHGIPSCIWSMPNLRLLHLSSNKLTGTLGSPPSSSPLKRVMLSHNYLSGTIPLALQNLPFSRLDLSNNRLHGGYTANVTGTKVKLALFNNRLSGPIPSSFSNINIESVSVRLGNDFECAYHSKDPAKDPYSNTTICGSNAFNDAAYFEVLVLVVCGAMMVLFLRGDDGDASGVPNVMWRARKKCRFLIIYSLRNSLSLIGDRVGALLLSPFSPPLTTSSSESEPDRRESGSSRSSANSSACRVTAPSKADDRMSRMSAFRLDILMTSTTEWHKEGSGDGGGGGGGGDGEKKDHDTVVSTKAACNALRIPKGSFAPDGERDRVGDDDEGPRLWAPELVLAPELMEFVSHCQTTLFLLAAALMVILILCLPLYPLLKQSDQFATQNPQYLWVTTSANLSRWPCAVGVIVIFAFLLLMAERQFRRYHEPEAKHHAGEKGWWGVFLDVAVFTTILAAINVANFCYLGVTLVKQSSTGIKDLAKILLAIFKVSFNMLVIPCVVNARRKWRYPASPAAYVQWQFFLLATNNMFMPLALTILNDIDCLGYIFASDEIIKEYFGYRTALPTVCVESGSQDSNSSNPFSACYTFSSLSSFVDEFYPPFIYSYTCGSAVVENYVPVLIYSYAFQTVLQPLLSGLLFSWLLRLDYESRMVGMNVELGSVSKGNPTAVRVASMDTPGDNRCEEHIPQDPDGANAPEEVKAPKGSMKWGRALSIGASPLARPPSGGPQSLSLALLDGNSESGKSDRATSTAPNGRIQNEVGDHDPTGGRSLFDALLEVVGSHVFGVWRPLRPSIGTMKEDEKQNDLFPAGKVVAASIQVTYPIHSFIHLLTHSLTHSLLTLGYHETFVTLAVSLGHADLRHIESPSGGCHLHGRSC